MATLAILGATVVAPVLAGFIVTDSSCPSGTRCYGGGYGDGGYGYGYGYGIGSSYKSTPYSDPNYGYGYSSGNTTTPTGSSTSTSGWGGGWGGGLGSSGGGAVITTTTPTVPGYEAILAQLANLVDKTVAAADTCKSCSVNYDGAMNSASMLKSSYEAFVKVFGNYKANKATKDEVVASFKTFAAYYYDVKAFSRTCSKTCDASVENTTDSDVLPATGAKTIKKRA